MAKAIIDFFTSCITEILRQLGWVLKEFGGNTANSFVGIRVYDFVGAFSGIFEWLGGFLVVIFWCLHLLENATTTELFTLRGGVKAFLRLLFGKIFVDLAVTICKWILEIGIMIMNAVFLKAGTVSSSMPSTIGTDVETKISGLVGGFSWVSIPLIGNALQDLIGLFFVLPFLIITIAVGLTMLGAIVKLAFKTFEIAGLMVMSPSFFACLSSDTTREYFKRFIGAFIGVVAELIFMALIFAMQTYTTGKLFQTTSTDMAEFLMTAGIQYSIIIALCWMMIFPPRVFKNLVS